MKRLLVPLSLVLLFMLQSCGPAIRIVSDRDENSRFDLYRTYNFLDFTDGNQKTIPGMELERLRVAFAHEIEKHGLKFSADSPDISVQITVYHREAVSGYYYGPYGYHYMERAIAIDYYDNASRKHVWHAAAVGDLDRDVQRRQENFPQVAAALFEQYPLHVPEVESD